MREDGRPHVGARGGIDAPTSARFVYLFNSRLRFGVDQPFVETRWSALHRLVQIAGQPGWRSAGVHVVRDDGTVFDTDPVGDAEHKLDIDFVRFANDGCTPTGQFSMAELPAAGTVAIEMQDRRRFKPHERVIVMSARRRLDGSVNATTYLFPRGVNPDPCSARVVWDAEAATVTVSASRPCLDRSAWGTLPTTKRFQMRAATAGPSMTCQTRRARSRCR